jgi:serine/threonine protein kinase
MSEFPTSDWTSINAAADRFERAWKRVPKPRIEDYLSEAAEDQRSTLFAELLRVELELRHREREEPKPEEYHRRFPAQSASIDAVFAPRPDAAATADWAESPRATSASTKAIPPELANNPDYEMVRSLGGGGMGLVFLAYNHIMGRDEVLKIISPDLIDSPDALDRFLREIRVVTSLQHPNIVSAYSAFSAGLSLVFAMEYVDGLDLARMVKAKGALPISNACSFIHQAALGLQHAHEAGLVHRDIKPGNLMLTHEEGRAVVKVLDFGLAKASIEQNVVEHALDERTVLSDLAASLTGAGMMLGTPNFIAPEQIANAVKADIRADVYSLGCTLYNLLGGRPPFEGKLYDVLKAHRSSAAQPLNVVRPEVPEELAALVAKAMAKKPAQRFQQPIEVAQALAPFFKTRSVAVQGATWSTEPGAQAESDPATSPQAVNRPAGETTRPAPGLESVIKLDLKVDHELKPAAAAEVSGKRSPRLLFVGAAAVGVAAFSLAAFYLVGNGAKQGFPGSTDTRVSHESPVPAAPPRGSEPLPDATPNDPVNSDRVAAKPPEEEAPAVLSAEAPPSPPAPDIAKPPATVPASKEVASNSENKGKVNVPDERRALTFEDQLDRAIQDGLQFLQKQQKPDGTWSEVENEAKTGTTSLITLALLTAGEKTESPPIRKALEYLRRFGATEINSTYAIALQTMVFAAAGPAETDRSRIAANVDWLERAQIKPADPVPWPGSWTYIDSRRAHHPGDNSNTQYALLGLQAASEAGAQVRPEVWSLARSYWENGQKPDGSWAYTPRSPSSTASMTCAGVTSLIIARHWSSPSRSQETLIGERIRDCGKGAVDLNVDGGIDWLANHFQVDENFGMGKQWKFYYLYGLERAGRLAGIRFFGPNDWYRLGATELVRLQQKPSGAWEGDLNEREKLLVTSFALMFLAKGRAPVLINKLRRLPPRSASKKARVSSDWNNDPDDVRNLVDMVARDRKSLLTWQVVDSRTATVADLRRAPILFFNGHRAPEFSDQFKATLVDFVGQGGTIFADACCDSPEFDKGFRRLMNEMFPEKERQLRPLTEDHPIYRARYLINSASHPLWGIQHDARVSVIYSPKDLSCFWNQTDRQPDNQSVARAIRIGQNVVKYVTGR